MPFDIAISEILPSHIPTNDSRHYVGSAQNQHRVCPPDFCKFNYHNSACVVLNMTSQRTQMLLRRSIEFFFSRNYENSTIDQPAIGRAMYEAWQQNGLSHVDLNQELVCRPKTHPAGKAGVVCSPDTTCAIAHKWDFARAKDATSPVLENLKQCMIYLMLQVSNAMTFQLWSQKLIYRKLGIRCPKNSSGAPIQQIAIGQLD